MACGLGAGDDSQQGTRGGAQARGEDRADDRQVQGDSHAEGQGGKAVGRGRRGGDECQGLDHQEAGLRVNTALGVLGHFGSSNER